MKINRNQIIALSILSLAIIVASYIVFSNKMNDSDFASYAFKDEFPLSKQQEHNLESFKEESHDIYAVLKSAQEMYKNKKLFDGTIFFNRGMVSWENPQGWKISSSDIPSVWLSTQCVGERISRFYEVVPEIFQKFDKVFTDLGFVLNSRNSLYKYGRDDHDSEDVYYKGYEKGNVKCLLSSYSGCGGLPGIYGNDSGTGSSVSISCTDRLDVDEKEQLPILKALNLKDYSIHWPKYFGDYVYFGYAYNGILAKKEKDGSYIKIYEGQDWLQCSEREGWLNYYTDPARKQGLSDFFDSYCKTDQIFLPLN